MSPLAVASLPAGRRRRRLAGVAAQPRRHVVVEELLRPEQPSKCLPLDAPLVLGKGGGLDGGIERIGLCDAIRKRLLKRVECGRWVEVAGREAQTQRRRSTGRNLDLVAGGRL